MIKNSENVKNVSDAADVGRTGLQDVSAQEMTGGMNVMVSGVDQVNKSVKHINELTNKNRETADHLMQEVQKFKIV